MADIGGPNGKGVVLSFSSTKVVRQMATALLLSAPVVSSAATQDTARIAYATSGKWNVQFNETACLAIQEYGAIDPAAPDQKMSLLFKYSPSGNVVALHVYRAAKRTVSVDQRKVAIQFDNRPALSLSSLRYGSSEKREKWIIDQVNLGPGAIDQLRKSSQMTTNLGGPAYHFPLLAMDRVMSTLDQCRKVLNDYWNIDAAIHRLAAADPTKKRKPGPVPPLPPGTPPIPITPANTLFSSNDYPAAALRSDQSGLTSAELLIDETGTVKECFVNETSGVATLDVMTCLRLMHAKYRPALDVNGKPVRSYDDVRIKWITSR